MVIIQQSGIFLLEFLLILCAKALFSLVGRSSLSSLFNFPGAHRQPHPPSSNISNISNTSSISTFSISESNYLCPVIFPQAESLLVGEGARNCSSLVLYARVVPARLVVQRFYSHLFLKFFFSSICLTRNVCQQDVETRSFWF